MTVDRRAFRARWLFPADSPPVANGTLVVEDGVISDVTTADVPDAIELANAAIVPGLVNAHTHLEFSHLAAPLTPAMPFTGWIGRVVAARHDPATLPAERIARGVDESIAAGVCAVGEIATSPSSEDILQNAALDTVLFREIIGLSDDHNPILEQLRRDFAVPTAQRIVKGLSPHAPYSVHPDLVAQLVELAAGTNRPVAMHLAETQSELEFLATRTGEFRDMLERFQIWPGDIWPQTCCVRNYLELLSSAPRALVVHGNYLTAEDQTYLAGRSNLSVVYCPRTHAFFGHQPHPWRELLARGVNVVLGTDGRCSNPDLSLWNEVLLLRALAPDLPTPDLLAMATHRGATALGLDPRDYRLQIGRPLRATVIGQIPRNETNPDAAVMHSRTVARPLP